MSTRSRDPYDVLGVARDASQEDVRRAYRRLARSHHPDVSKEPDAETRFKDISEAYDVLRDPERRAAYDRFGPDWRAAQQSGAGAGRRRASRRSTADGGPGGVFEEEVRFEDVEDLFGGGGFGDVFGDLFRGRGGGGFSMGGADMEAVRELSLEEAARGGRRRISVDGRGIEIDIPPGVTDGQRIRLAGQGSAGAGGGPAGDLHLRVRLRPHPRFRVDGRDLHVELPVSPADAALGASVEVPTLDGTARVKVPPGSSSGRRLRLRGKGLPNPAGSLGDLYATVRIVVPRRLSDEEREAYERLRQASRATAGSRAS
ncbi:MAG TPA: DnaJ C-terminal domain-containing protein [Miltoncostaea sp.]|nr:DnaJ C-terminal domain-containing protein [Miltoncostaea sp.]